MGLLDRIQERTRPSTDAEESRYTADQYLTQYLLPAQQQAFSYNGSAYPFGLQQTWTADRSHEISASLPSYAQAVQGCPPAFAAQMFRSLVLSQARFTFRRLATSGPNSRKTFGTNALSQLENPWPNATSGELLSRMEWHAGLAGNAYVYRQPGRLRVLRPDWVVLVYGSQQEPDDAAHALDGTLLGYVYCNNGLHSGNTPRTLLPNEVAHWSPIPDPTSAGVGMSWLTPAIRDITGDRAMAEHKLKFFQNGATPNLVVKGITAATSDKFAEIVEQLERQHSGLANAYKTLYLSAGADATVVGSDLKGLDYKNIVEAGENRIAVLSRVPAALLGITEGLKGSSLNAGNFKTAQRSFTDAWMQPMLADLCASLSSIVDVPSGAELWFDGTDVGLNREDGLDAAQITEIQARTITILVREGFTPESAKAAVIGQDMTMLEHTGLVSVQLWEPGAPPPDPNAPGSPQLSGSPNSTGKKKSKPGAPIGAPGGGGYVPVGSGPSAPPGESPS